MERTAEKETRIGQREKATLFRIIDALCSHKHSGPFLRPVDYIRLGLPDYPLIIEHPMDLETVRCKLRDYKYRFVEECLRDLLLIWENCRKYNPPKQLLPCWADELQTYQLRMVKNYLPELKTKSSQQKRSADKQIHQMVSSHLQEAEVQCKMEANPEEDKIQPPIKEEVLPASVSLPEPALNDHCISNQAHSRQKEPQSEQKKVIDSQRKQCSKWEMAGRQIREQFLSSLEECNDCEVTLIFMMIKRRCFACIDFDSHGNSSINLNKIDDYTLMLAKNQIKAWRSRPQASPS